MENVADTAANTAEASAYAAHETVAKAAVAGDRVMKDAMARASELGDQAFKDGIDKSMTALNEVNAQSKRNLEAIVASVTAATKGAETLSAQAMAYTKKAVEGQVEQARALTSARSVQEVFELQSNFAKSSLEAYVAELNRMTEILSGAMKESFRPLNERATAMVETMQAVR
jgi:phasin family protein